MFSTHLQQFVLKCFLVVASVPIAQGASFPRPPSSGELDQDVLLQHMSKLHERCNKEQRLKEGNTARSFRASQVPSDLRTVYHLNLTTLQDSEVILSATFHFLLGRLPPQKAWICKRFKSASCRSSATQPSPLVSLLLRAVSSGSGVSSGSSGSFLANVTFHPNRRGVWQMKDVTQVIQEARDKGHRLVSVELDLGQHYKAEDSGYLLVYADDLALAEPNSVYPSLQRYDPFSESGEPSQSPDLMYGPNFSPQLKGRVRREATSLPDSIQNNELPEVDYRTDGYRKDDLWESSWYPALKAKPKAGKQEKKRKSHEDGGKQSRGGHEKDKSTQRTSDRSKFEASSVRRYKEVDSQRQAQKHEVKDVRKHNKASAHHSRSPLLNFDDETMRKARRKQWADTRHHGCSRKNLRVDFADIGWSEWIVAPKAFDAYYCSGTCGFPMPKVVRPSNHATIQSIVRAVGIISGVPEPCCVPERMSPLAVLYREESKDLVLKMYPDMSVQSCSCR
ncbi:growth/differentiation factor 10 [Syngnathus acus]|uniref:growth/differentiation factor 10 n=1 Tax=Syngnathus acus TaxID=161584 RepID=UPI001885E417|nr:growth/differentiation factor 10 [Syngnathus acus]